LPAEKTTITASIPAELRGYVQLALDAGLMNARFTLTQGTFDPQPVVHAYFHPGASVTRAEYAVAAGRLSVDSGDHGHFGWLDSSDHQVDRFRLSATLVDPIPRRRGALSTRYGAA